MKEILTKFLGSVLLPGTLFAFGWCGGNIYQKATRCSSKEPCVFGPGIVGVQDCVGGELQNCEPDPSYKNDDLRKQIQALEKLLDSFPECGDPNNKPGQACLLPDRNLP